MTVVAFLLTNLNPDLRSRTHSLIYRSVKLTLLRTKPILGPVQTSCFCCAKLNSGIKFDKSTAEARGLNQTFELSSASN